MSRRFGNLLKAVIGLTLLLTLILHSCSEQPVVSEVVSKPDLLSGPTSLHESVVGTYVAEGAVSSHGHKLAYQFDWDDGSRSGWDESSEASHSWRVKGEYKVRARASAVSRKVGVFSEPF